MSKKTVEVYYTNGDWRSFGFDGEIDDVKIREWTGVQSEVHNFSALSTSDVDIEVWAGLDQKCWPPNEKGTRAARIQPRCLSVDTRLTGTVVIIREFIWGEERACVS